MTAMTLILMAFGVAIASARFTRVAEVGSGTGDVTRRISPLRKVLEWMLS